MNSVGAIEELPGPPPPPEIDTSTISRSGRVRKKNSLLAGFEEESLPAGNKRRSTPGGGGSTRTPKGPSRKPARPPSSKKTPPAKRTKFEVGENSLGAFEGDEDSGDLEIDLPQEEFEEGEIPQMLAEEIIDEGMLDEEDGATELITESTQMNRLKSQAQSTYMMERSMNRKNTSISVALRGKNQRRDKNNPRITAYIVWAKEQRAIFAKKYPSLDFTQVTKKLADLWALVPQNQRKVYKNKAAKLMKKNASASANMKNSSHSATSSSSAYAISSAAAADNNNIKIAPGIPIFHELPGKRGKKSKMPGLGLVNHTGLPNNTSNSKKVGKGPKFRNSAETPSSLINPPPKRKSIKSKGKASSKLKNTKITSKPPPTKSKSTPNNAKTNARMGNNRKSNSKSPVNNSVNVQLFKNGSNFTLSPKKDDEMYKVTGSEPIDLAAHFSLLGESLSIIGERLKEHEGSNVSGSLSVLLDSLLCSLGPLIGLTQQVPELDCIPPETLANTLENIAFLMPGL